MPSKNAPLHFRLNEAQHEALMRLAKVDETPPMAAKRLLLTVVGAGAKAKEPEEVTSATLSKSEILEHRLRKRSGMEVDAAKEAEREAKWASLRPKHENRLQPGWPQPQRDELDELDDVMPFGADPEVWQKKLALKAKLEELQGVPRWDEELET